MDEAERTSRRGGGWGMVALVFGIVVVFVVLFTTLVFTVDPDSATAASGYVAGGTWLVVLVLHAARTLTATIAARPDPFDVRVVALALAGLVASVGVAALNRLDVIDAATGITGELLVGSFAVAALLVAIARAR